MMTNGIERWFGCYSGQRGDLFLPKSNRHPAKMAVGLCYRIFEHGQKRGYWKPGDVMLDPMCGIGTTMIVGLTLGYDVVGVELEEHFVKLTGLNLLCAVERLGSNLKTSFRLIHGDARRLSKLLDGGAVGVVSSPPYADASLPSGMPHKIRSLAKQGRWDEAIAQAREYEKYQLAQGWIRAVRRDDELRKRIEQALEVDAGNGGRAPNGVLSSPPYPSEFREQHPGTEGGQVGLEFERGGSFRGYGGAVTSPPYGNEGCGHDAGHPRLDAIEDERREREGMARRAAYGTERNGAQIGNLRDPVGDIDVVLSGGWCECDES